MKRSLQFPCLVICQLQCKAGDKIDNIVISILSAIQQSPVHKDNLTWNQPKPKALTACVTVNVSKIIIKTYIIFT